mgnify:CR=1 FL=1
MNSINAYKEGPISFFMNAKIKKKHNNGIIRVEASGEIKEVLFKEDFLSSNKPSIALCFRSKDSSGIIELNRKEAEDIIDELSSRKDLLKSAKVMKFEK